MDYEAFADAGAMVGHGGVVVWDDTMDASAMARFAMEFCAKESCGKCTPCRIGSTRGVEVIDRIRAASDDGVRRTQLVLLEDLCTTMTKGSLCAMGGLTPMPVRSALEHFPEDFGLAHEDGREAAAGIPGVGDGDDGWSPTMTLIDEPALETPDRGTPPVLGEATAHVTRRRHRGDGAGRHLGDAGGVAGRASPCRSCAPPTRSRRSGRAGSASSRSRA